MKMHVIIDGNNLFHAMHAHAPIPLVARETMVKIIERWARPRADDVTLVLDGPAPRGGLLKQMTSSRIVVRFSAPQTADDIIVALVRKARDPGCVRVVSSDTALRHAARARRCHHTDSVSFIRELFAKPGDPFVPAVPADEKPQGVTPEESRRCLEQFGFDEDDEPFEGHDAMHPY